MFSCVWLHFKKIFEKYFLVFGCVLENTIENTFSTCCSHFLTFSRLPNEYIISFIPQYRNTNKTQKKNHQIRSNPVTFSHSFSVAKQILQNYSFLNTETQTKPRKKIINSRQIERRRKRERRLGSTRGEIARRRQRRDQRGASRDCDRRFTRSRSTLREIVIGAVLRKIAIGASRDRDRHEGEIAIDDAIFLPLRVREIVLSLSLSLSLSLRAGSSSSLFFLSPSHSVLSLFSRK